MELFGLLTCAVLYRCRKYGFVQTGLWELWRICFDTKQVE